MSRSTEQNGAHIEDEKSDGRAASAEGGHVEKPPIQSDFPEGGLRAWLVVAGASAANTCTFGWINCERKHLADARGHLDSP